MVLSVDGFHRGEHPVGLFISIHHAPFGAKPAIFTVFLQLIPSVSCRPAP